MAALVQSVDRGHYDGDRKSKKKKKKAFWITEHIQEMKTR